MRRPQNLKNLPPVFTKQLFLLSSVKTSGRSSQIFVAFSEKVDFTSFCFIWIFLLWRLQFLRRMKDLWVNCHELYFPRSLKHFDRLVSKAAVLFQDFDGFSSGDRWKRWEKGSVEYLVLLALQLLPRHWGSSGSNC